MGERRTPPAGESDGDTEARILAAARRVFVRRGTSGARMHEIAAEAGVNQALLHYYFRSKDRLADAVFREVAGRVIPQVAGLFASGISLDRKVERFVHLYIDSVREHPYIPAYIISELHQHPERIATMAAAVGAIRPGVDNGPIARPILVKLGRQLSALERKGLIRRTTPSQFLVNVFALAIFPFLARPVLGMVMGFDTADFDSFLDERRAALPAFIMNALRP